MHHWCNHLSQRSRKEFSWLTNNIFWDTFPEQKISASIRKMITVMLKHMILVHAPLTLIFPQKLHKKLLMDFCEPKG